MTRVHNLREPKIVDETHSALTFGRFNGPIWTFICHGRMGTMEHGLVIPEFNLSLSILHFNRPFLATSPSIRL
jgi:hypothetical protein